MTATEDLVRKAFQAYETKRREDLAPLLSDDFTFSSPHDDRIDQATYWARCWPNSEAIKSFKLEKVFVKGDEAFVLYEAEMLDGRRFRNTEFFRTDGRQIRAVEVYFGWDTRPAAAKALYS